MRVVLLAAGAATRLRPLTDQMPKCLLRVGDKSIVSRTVELCAARGLRRFTVVDGFCAEALRRALQDEFPGEWFEFVHNERYASTNNGYSLWLSMQPEPEPMLLCDSDVLFDPEVLDRLLDAAFPSCIAVRDRGEIGAEEMKVVLRPDGRVRTIAKTVRPADAAGESVGLHRFDAAFCRELYATLDRRMRSSTHEHEQEYYEDSLVELLEGGASLWPVPLGGLRSLEIDTAEDLDRARAEFG
jgi:choline kinase